MAYIEGTLVKRRDSQFESDATFVRRRDYLELDVDSVNDTDEYILSLPGIPRHNDTDPADSRMRVNRLSVRRHPDNGLRRIIEIGYEGLRTGPDIPDPPEIPSGLEWLPQVTWDSADSTEQFDLDAVDGTEIKNPVGQAYDPPLSRDRSDPVLTISRIEETYSPSIQKSFVNMVNTTSFWGAAPGTCRCKKITAQYLVIQNVLAWRVTYVFAFRFQPDESGNEIGWHFRVAERGTWKLSSGDVVPITHGDLGDTGLNQYDPVTEPVNLNADGSVRTSGTTWKTWNGYEGIDFGPLNLDLPAIRQKWLAKLSRDIYGS